MNELQVLEPNPPPVRSLIEVIARAAADPTTDVAKMERLYDMMSKENARIAQQQYMAAMSLAQAEMPMVIKRSKNPQTNSRYANLEAICKAIAPIVEKNGFSISTSEGDSPNPLKIRVVAKVSHSGGHSEMFHMDLSPDDMGQKENRSKTKIHGEGSTFSYGRRYLTTMIFNLTIIGEDDDGNQGSRPRPAGPGAVQKQPAPMPAHVETPEEVKAAKKHLWAVTVSIHGETPTRKGDPRLLRQWLIDECDLDPSIEIESLTAAELTALTSKAKVKLHV